MVTEDELMIGRKKFRPVTLADNCKVSSATDEVESSAKSERNLKVACHFPSNAASSSQYVNSKPRMIQVFILFFTSVASKDDTLDDGYTEHEKIHI